MKNRGKKLFGAVVMMLMIALMAMPVSAAPKLNKKTATLSVGQSVNLKVKGKKGNVKWSSSNKKVASVKKGTVTAKKAGNATITAKVGKIKLTCRITVKKNEWKGYTKKQLLQLQAWSSVPLSDNSMYTFVKAQPYELSYNSKGILSGKMAVFNMSGFYSYKISKMNVTITDQKGNVIAEGYFDCNGVISPNTVGTFSVLFDNNGTKKVVDLKRAKLRYTIYTKG